MADDKIERDEISNLPKDEGGKTNLSSVKTNPELSPEELDKVAGGVVTHIPGNPI